jgi:hypothetical protein
MSQSPAGFFRFSYKAESLGSEPDRVYAIAYKVPGPLKKGAIEDLMLSMVRGPSVPDAVALLCLEEDEPRVRASLTDELSRLAQERLTGRIPLLLASYRMRKGSVTVTLMDTSFRKQGRLLRQPIQDRFATCLSSGLETLFAPRSVLLEAPPGYAYHKPRGSRSEFFLKPDMAMESSGHVGFVALAVFHKAFASIERPISDFDQIFVDSMAIAPVAYALRELLVAAGGSRAISIDSFHSYRGFAEVPRPLPGTSLCLISASSSMALHVDWLREKQVGRDEVLTLLSFDDVDGVEGALTTIPRPVSRTGRAQAPLSIHIKGESFLPVPEPTKKVLLTEEAHKCDAEAAVLQRFARSGVFDVFRRTSAPNSKARSLFVDGQKLIKRTEFVGWLEDQVKQKLKAATKTVVFQDDSSSFALAKLVKNQAELAFGLTGLRLVSSTSLVEEEFALDEGVVVCAAVTGKGSQLLQISRDLRDKQKGPRLYLIGVQVADLRSEIGNLASNLRFSKTASYDVVQYAGLAIGSELSEAFTREMAEYYPRSATLQNIPAGLRRRAQALGSVKPIGDRVLLPKGRNAIDALQLRPGFAFWIEPYAAGPLHAEVLATISVVLQRAREEKNIPLEKRLSTGMFGHVALDPANFTRFNDGVIQAALLRCSRASEIDYRSDYAASDFMKALLMKMLERLDGQTGEAILEFCLALGLRRLQLVDEHLADVLTFWDQRKRRSGSIGKAISFLLAPLSAVNPSPSKLPF